MTTISSSNTVICSNIFDFYTQKFFVYCTPPYLLGCIHFRLNLLTAIVSVSKYLFSFSSVGISPSVWSFSSSSGLVQIGFYPFLLDVSGSQSRFLHRSRLLRFLIPIPIFASGSGLFSVCHSVYLVVFRSTECISRRRLGDSVGFRCDLFSDLRCPFFLLFGLKYNWPEICFRCISFPLSVVTVWSVPLTAVCIFF